jgi:excisionase family DNA binding protein
MTREDKLCLSVPENAKLLGISRALAYELVACNQLPAIRLGRRLLVPRRAIETFLRRAGRRPNYWSVVTTAAGFEPAPSPPRPRRRSHAWIA